MTSLRGNWLDRLALRSSRGATREQGSDAPPGFDEERISRATAVRLAGAGAASFALGLWRAEPALALTFPECVRDCERNIDKIQVKWVDKCTETFGEDPKWMETRPWRAFALTFLLPGYMIPSELGAACKLAGWLLFEKARRDCASDCRKKCQTLRSLQGGSRRSLVCEAPPPPRPPKNYTPAPPPAPNPTKDPCAACIAVGGVICPPFCPDACNCSGLTGPNACDYVKGFRCP